METSERFFSFDEIRVKLEYWCAYRDRCVYETRQKIDSYSLNEKEKQQLLSSLLESKFIDEERFALSFTSGKFRLKGWGKYKISLHLKAKRVDVDLISQAILEIDDVEYMKTIDRWLVKKIDLLGKEKDPWIKRQKAIQYLATKGFEMDLILDRLKLVPTS
jgi:regulatory protein